MKKTRSTTLRRAWPSSDFSDRASERTRSRSEKDYRLHKHKHYPPQYLCQSPPGYITPGGSHCRAGDTTLALLRTCVCV